jgi:hypothetical protein
MTITVHVSMKDVEVEKAGKEGGEATRGYIPT